MGDFDTVVPRIVATSHGSAGGRTPGCRIGATRLFFRLAQAPPASTDVGADLIYNDYPSYLRVLDALARFVEDADFAMRFEQEDDAGDDYYVVDACRIHGGALSVTRRLTRTPERSEGAG